MIPIPPVLPSRTTDAAAGVAQVMPNAATRRPSAGEAAHPTPLRRCLGKAVLLALVTVCPSAQQPGAGAAKPPPLGNRATQWPPLKDTDKERVLGLVGQFRKPETALHEPARAQLVAIGPAAVPLLLLQVSDRAENVNSHLFLVFDHLMQPEHAALMAREWRKPKVDLRRYLTQRLARFLDPEMLPILEAAAKDKDPDVAFYGAVGLLGQKRTSALPAVLANCRQRWNDVLPLCADVLPAARSAEVGSAVFEAIAKAQPADQMTGLRIARFVATKDHVVIVRTYLASADHAVKKEAVNLARVLHGQEAIENLSVFQAIEMAKEWLNKI
jgi:hypothetical protein